MGLGGGLKRSLADDQVIQGQKVKAARRTRNDSAHGQLVSQQKALLLHAKGEPYTLTKDHPLPEIKTDDEVLVRTHAIGLNPIDWKSPDYGFGIPVFPFISGRELVGEVVSRSRGNNRRLKEQERVIVISTDYRDLRKAAFQEYVVAKEFNIAKLPPSVLSQQGAAIGVAFVSAILSLSVCVGLDFSIIGGPDLYSTLRAEDPLKIPADVRSECTKQIPSAQRAHRGDWLAIWGGSGTCAFLMNQLARLAGLRTILVLDLQKHGYNFYSEPEFYADAFVDSRDADRAIEIIRAITGGQLKFAIDVVGRTTAECLQRCLMTTGDFQENKVEKALNKKPPSSPSSKYPTSQGEVTTISTHLVGLTGLPKGDAPAGMTYHAVPVKIFHEIPAVGQKIVDWLEDLLDTGCILPPRVLGVVDGLEGINGGLDRMRRGEISAGRLVAKLR